ncbi:hypothetical protein ACJX0J_029656, partial [Zea mays]
ITFMFFTVDLITVFAIFFNIIHLISIIIVAFEIYRIGWNKRTFHLSPTCAQIGNVTIF